MAKRTLVVTDGTGDNFIALPAGDTPDINYPKGSNSVQGIVQTSDTYTNPRMNENVVLTQDAGHSLYLETKLHGVAHTGDTPPICNNVNSAAAGSGSMTSRDGEFSVGSEDNPRKVANVAPAVAPTDAVPLGQLETLLDTAAPGFIASGETAGSTEGVVALSNHEQSAAIGAGSTTRERDTVSVGSALQPNFQHGFDDITMVSSRANVILVSKGTSDHLFISSNNAVTWEKITFPSGVAFAPTGVVVADDVVLLLNGTGSYLRSADSGKTWSVIDNPSAYKLGNRGIYYNNILRLAKQGLVYDEVISRDKGLTWELADTSVRVNTYVVVGDTLYATCEASGAEFHTTKDNLNWTKTYRFGTFSVQGMLYTQGVFIVFVNGNVYTSTDAYTWTVMGKLATSGGIRPHIISGRIVVVGGGKAYLSDVNLTSIEQIGSVSTPYLNDNFNPVTAAVGDFVYVVQGGSSIGTSPSKQLLRITVDGLTLLDTPGITRLEAIFNIGGSIFVHSSPQSADFKRTLLTSLVRRVTNVAPAKSYDEAATLGQVQDLVTTERVRIDALDTALNKAVDAIPYGVVVTSKSGSRPGATNTHKNAIALGDGAKTTKDGELSLPTRLLEVTKPEYINALSRVWALEQQGRRVFINDNGEIFTESVTGTMVKTQVAAGWTQDAVVHNGVLYIMGATNEFIIRKTPDDVASEVTISEIPSELYDHLFSAFGNLYVFRYNASSKAPALIDGAWREISIPYGRWGPGVVHKGVAVCRGFANTSVAEVMYSEDGLEWTRVALPMTSAVRAIASVGGRLVAFPMASGAGGAYSDNGVVWYPLAIPSGDWNYARSAGLFSIVFSLSGDGADAIISTNGLVWEKIRLANPVIANTAYRLGNTLRVQSKINPTNEVVLSLENLEINNVGTGGGASSAAAVHQVADSVRDIQNSVMQGLAEQRARRLSNDSIGAIIEHPTLSAVTVGSKLQGSVLGEGRTGEWLVRRLSVSLNLGALGVLRIATLEKIS